MLFFSSSSYLSHVLFCIKKHIFAGCYFGASEQPDNQGMRFNLILGVATFFFFFDVKML